VLSKLLCPSSLTSTERVPESADFVGWAYVRNLQDLVTRLGYAIGEQQDAWARTLILTIFGPGLTWLLITLKICLKRCCTKHGASTSADAQPTSTRASTAPQPLTSEPAAALDQSLTQSLNQSSWPVARSLSIEQIGGGGRGDGDYRDKSQMRQAMLCHQASGSWMHRNSG